MKKLAILFCLLFSLNVYSEEVDSDNKYCSREYCDIYVCISDYIENNTFFCCKGQMRVSFSESLFLSAKIVRKHKPKMYTYARRSHA